ncbi:MAG: 3-keto-disaccharide hydrolase [Verrucomicrobiales bacterium]
MTRLTTKLLLAAAIAATTASAMAADGKLGYTNTPLIPGTKWHVHDGDRPQPPIVTPAEKFSHMAPAPSDAKVLFDGKDLSQWQLGNGQPAKWKIENGYMEVAPKSGSIRTKEKFADFQLHIEFATPEKVDGNGQGRGNSGILMNGIYEVQVLDSYNNPTYPDGQTGGLYGQTPPLVNASKPPGQWQTYDIVFESPRWDENGKIAKKAAVTVIHNGVLLHHRREYLGHTPHQANGNYNKPHAPEMYIELQDHNNPMRFRNVWIRSIGEYDKGAAEKK